MSELTKGPSYAPRPCCEYYMWEGPKDWRMRFAADQAKFNLAWLVVPEIESLGVIAIPEELAKSIDEHMSREMRFKLYEQPLKFLQYWGGLFKGDEMIPVISAEMPKGYDVLMRRRAHEAQKLFVRRDGNIITAKFGRSAT